MIKLKDLLSEKSVSKAQQRFFGMVYALKKGELNYSDVDKDVRDAAKSMSMKDVKDFASTKHKGLTEGLDKKEMQLLLKMSCNLLHQHAHQIFHHH